MASVIAAIPTVYARVVFKGSVVPATGFLVMAQMIRHSSQEKET